jgi:hypothetical protein
MKSDTIKIMNSDTIKKKRYYIYENIQKIKNHNQIIDMIQLNKCKYTENENGIFLNLNTINDKMVNYIYNYLINTLNYKEEVNEFLDLDTNVDTTNVDNDYGDIMGEVKKKGYTKKNISLEEKVLMSDFNEKEQEIIKETKNYNL